jgi:hypothetical protein
MRPRGEEPYTCVYRIRVCMYAAESKAQKVKRKHACECGDFGCRADAPSLPLETMTTATS